MSRGSQNASARELGSEEGDGGAAALARDAQRSRRHRPVRAQTISVKRLSQRELIVARLLYPEAAERRLPVLRGECIGRARPCPFVSCSYHLFLDVSPQTGAIKVNFPDLMDEDGGIRFEEMPETCALDVADRGGTTADRVARLTNLTRERVRQIEASAFAALVERVRGPESPYRR